LRRQSRRAKRNTKRGALRHGPKARNRRQAICSQALSSGLRTTRRPLSAPPASGALRDVLACHASLSGSLGGREGIRGYPRWRAACDDAPFLGVLGSLAFAWCDASRPGDPRSLRPGPSASNCSWRSRKTAVCPWRTTARYGARRGLAMAKRELLQNGASHGLGLRIAAVCANSPRLRDVRVSPGIGEQRCAGRSEVRQVGVRPRSAGSSAGSRSNGSALAPQ